MGLKPRPTGTMEGLNAGSGQEAETQGKERTPMPTQLEMMEAIMREAQATQVAGECAAAENAEEKIPSAPPNSLSLSAGASPISPRTPLAVPVGHHRARSRGPRLVGSLMRACSRRLSEAPTLNSFSSLAGGIDTAAVVNGTGVTGSGSGHGGCSSGASSSMKGRSRSSSTRSSGNAEGTSGSGLSRGIEEQVHPDYSFQFAEARNSRTEGKLRGRILAYRPDTLPETCPTKVYTVESEEAETPAAEHCPPCPTAARVPRQATTSPPREVQSSPQEANLRIMLRQWSVRRSNSTLLSHSAPLLACFAPDNTGAGTS